MDVRPLNDGDRVWFAETISREWGLPVVSISGPHNPIELPGFIATQDGERIGAITYRTTGDECEVVTLNSFRPSRGVGTALLAAVKAIADRGGLRLWLITTDENVDAIRFYESRGMIKRNVHRNFVDLVHTYKPGSGGSGHRSDYRDAAEYSF